MPVDLLPTYLNRIPYPRDGLMIGPSLEAVAKLRPSAYAEVTPDVVLALGKLLGKRTHHSTDRGKAPWNAFVFNLALSRERRGGMLSTHLEAEEVTYRGEKRVASLMHGLSVLQAEGRPASAEYELAYGVFRADEDALPALGHRGMVALMMGIAASVDGALGVSDWSYDKASPRVLGKKGVQNPGGVAQELNAMIQRRVGDDLMLSLISNPGHEVPLFVSLVSTSPLLVRNQTSAGLVFAGKLPVRALVQGLSLESPRLSAEANQVLEGIEIDPDYLDSLGNKREAGVLSDEGIRDELEDAVTSPQAERRWGYQLSCRVGARMLALA